MERRIKKILIVFFCFMMIFTIVSRATASVMVAKVDVDHVKEKNLTYEISGTGLVKENAQKYIDLMNGFKISKVNIEDGQTVEKGDWLFSYDLNQLKERESGLEQELKKLELDYEKAELTLDASSESAVTTANLAEQAARQDLSQAENDLEESKKETKDNKKTEYDTAVLELQETTRSKDEALKTLKRAVLDGENQIKKLEKPKSNLEELLANYKVAVEGKMETQIGDLTNRLFDLYYSGKYEEHQEKVASAEKVLQRAREDYADILNKWNKTINPLDQYSSDEVVRDAYNDQIAEKEEEVKHANRTISDAQDSLDQLKKNDNILSSAIQNYRYAILNNSTTSLQSTYDILYEFLYDSLNIDEDQIETAQTHLDRAKEDEEAALVQWDQKIKVATEKVEKLYEELESMEQGTYQYEKELKVGTKEVQNAERALDATKEQLTLAQKNSKIAQQANHLDMADLQIDIDEKQEQVNEIKEMILKKGKVFSPIDGTISQNELTLGGTITGAEKLLIATGGYELLMTADKEDMENFTVGSEVLVKMNSGSEDISTQIENIQLPDENGMVNFTALLPEGMYRENASLEFELKKESQNYSMCIPIQAVRQDMQGTYVLVVKEQDGVLGTWQTAFKLEVTVLSQDFNTAAINASLFYEDSIIIGSSKNMEEGDRVQVNETE